MSDLLFFFLLKISQARGCAPGFCISVSKWLPLALAQLMTKAPQTLLFPVVASDASAASFKESSTKTARVAD